MIRRPAYSNDRSRTQATTPTGTIHLDDYEAPTVDSTKNQSPTSAALKRGVLVFTPKTTAKDELGSSETSARSTLRICADHAEDLEV